MDDKEKPSEKYAVASVGALLQTVTLLHRIKESKDKDEIERLTWLLNCYQVEAKSFIEQIES